METRNSVGGLEIRQGEEGQPATLQGLAVPYYDPGNPATEYVRKIGDIEVRERMMPGAFDDSLASGDQWSFWNHDSSQLLGRRSAGTLSVRDSSDGPRYSVTLPDTAVGRDVEVSVRRGDVGGTSIGFVNPEQELRREGDNVVIREIRKAELVEISPTPIPAYRETSVAMRSDTSFEGELQSQLAAWKEQDNRHARAKSIAKMTELGL